MKKLLLIAVLFSIVIYGCSYNSAKKVTSLGYEYSFDGFYKSIADGNTEALNLFIKDNFLNKEKHSRNPLIIAIKSKSIDIVELLLQNGVDVNQKIKPMPIEYAVQQENIEVIKCLIDRGAKLNTIANPLYYAVKSKNIDIINLILSNGAKPSDEELINIAIENSNFTVAKLLYDYGADINHIENKGNIHKEALKLGYSYDNQGYIKSLQEKNSQALQFFLKNGFDPNLNIDHSTWPLVTAVFNKDKENIQLLLKYGANINKGDFYGDTALSYAISKGYDMVSLLLANGADVNINSPLCKAAELGLYDISKLLLEHDADPNNTYGFETPLICAARADSLSIIKLLLSFGADINKNTAPEYEDGSVLNVATTKGNLSIVKYLVSNGADIHYYNDLPLSTAAMSGSMEIVEYLLSKGCKPNNGKIMIPICEAAKNNDLKMLDLLLENGAEIDKYATDDYFKNTAISEAAHKGYLDVVEFLIKKGADIHRTDSANPLVAAAAGGKLEVVKHLLKLGVNKDIKDSLGKTPLSEASYWKQKEVVEFLESYTK